MTEKLKIAERFFNIISKSRGFDLRHPKVRLLSFEDRKLKCEFKISEKELDILGTLHSGFVGFTVDVVTSAALLCENPQNGGVSVNLSMNYHQPAYEGMDLILDARLQKLGKKLATMNISIKDKKTGDLIVTGVHTKFL